MRGGARIGDLEDTPPHGIGNPQDLNDGLSGSRSTEAPIHSRNPRSLLQLVVEGRSGARIAEVLHLSPKTVETYRSNLMKKLEIQTLPELVKFAIKYGLTPLEQTPAKH